MNTQRWCNDINGAVGGVVICGEISGHSGNRGSDAGYNMQQGRKGSVQKGGTNGEGLEQLEVMSYLSVVVSGAWTAKGNREQGMHHIDHCQEGGR